MRERSPAPESDQPGEQSIVDRPDQLLHQLRAAPRAKHRGNGLRHQLANRLLGRRGSRTNQPRKVPAKLGMVLALIGEWYVVKRINENRPVHVCSLFELRVFPRIVDDDEIGRFQNVGNEIGIEDAPASQAVAPFDWRGAAMGRCLLRLVVKLQHNANPSADDETNPHRTGPCCPNLNAKLSVNPTAEKVVWY